MPEDLLDQLSPPGVNHREVLSRTSRLYKTCAIADNGDLLFPATSEFELLVRGRSGRIRRVEAGPGFVQSRFDELRRDIDRTLVQSQGETVARVVAFSSPYPIMGGYTSDEAGVRLVEAPPEAPRPTTIMGSHPLVLEFRLSRSIEFAVTNERRLRTGTDWTWILNALLRSHVWTPSSRAQEHWVGDWQPAVRNRALIRLRRLSHRLTGGRLPRIPLPKKHSVKWLREFYDYPGFAPISDDFSGGGQGATLIPHDIYYSSDYERRGDVAELPDSLGKLINSAAHLSPDHRESYLRAASWVHAAGRLWDVQLSAWFIALVAAIETLMPAPTERCPTCNAVRYVTRNFRDFVERYATGSDRKGRNAIYDMRSDLAHGSRLMELDEAPWTFGVRMDMSVEYSTGDQLALVVREVMLNWLLEHAQERPNSGE